MTFWKRKPATGVTEGDALTILQLKEEGLGPAAIVRELKLPYPAVEGIYYNKTARFRYLYGENE